MLIVFPCIIAVVIEQALMSEKVSQLAKVLAEFKSKLGSLAEISPDHGTAMMTSSVSRDACSIFLFSGSSVEAEVYRQLVVDKINDNDIATALKLCCIGHQIPFFRDNMNINRPISDAQILRETFDRFLSVEPYDHERFKFMSICDEWYKVLEPEGLMKSEQRELLREWISNRQYANVEDPNVSLVVTQCLVRKQEEDNHAREERRS